MPTIPRPLLSLFGDSSARYGVAQSTSRARPGVARTRPRGWLIESVAHILLGATLHDGNRGEPRAELQECPWGQDSEDVVGVDAGVSPSKPGQIMCGRRTLAVALLPSHSYHRTPTIALVLPLVLCCLVVYLPIDERHLQIRALLLRLPCLDLCREGGWAGEHTKCRLHRDSVDWRRLRAWITSDIGRSAVDSSEAFSGRTSVGILTEGSSSR